MRLIDVSLGRGPGVVRLVGLVEQGPRRERIEIHFEFPERFLPFLDESADAFAAAILLPSMRAGERLEIAPPISPRLLFDLSRIRDVFHTWYPDLERIDIVADARSSGAPPGADRAACFFSGGVDSFYTLLKRRRAGEALPAPLTHLIFMRGIETRLEWTRGVGESQRLVEEVARAMGMECIFGRTNIRSEFPLHWQNYYYGAGLAATALALSRGLDYVCIPSSHSYRHMVPIGSTPLVDELYSTERLRIVHDGAESSRAEKVAHIVAWDRELVLKHLRVCHRNDGGAFNCGECYKCVRTEIPLAVLGVLDEAELFANRSRAHWERVIARDQLVLTEENLVLARERGADPELTGMLERVVRRARRREGLRSFVDNSPLRRLRPWLRFARRHLRRRRSRSGQVGARRAAEGRSRSIAGALRS
jgi:hypothetical protein